LNFGDAKTSSRFSVLRALHSGRASEALTEAESLLANDQLSWRDLLLVAELYVALGKDATALLVKAAKMNPRSSRVFFVLGRALRRKNVTKSKSCLERAVKIRPTNEEYVKELDEVYEETAESIDQRLAVLKSLAASKKPLWLRKKLVTLSRSKQDWDTVISELQQIVRYCPGDILSWASLAEAYSYRGNLQSSVNAYDRVLEMDPGSDYAICLIQVMMRMHNLEGAAEQCARWRTVTGRNQQLKTAVDILEAQVHLRCFVSAVGKQKMDLLNQVFMLLDSVISERPRISLAYKLTADALLHAIKFREDLLESLSIPSSWSISSRLSAARLAVAFYSVALDLNRENAWAWMDLSAALLILARLDPSEQQAVK
uniref:TPR_REGION domain-containing protein n=1 Tax=Nippostrongylus brasiliensis TaxID=27835 RepID=A0A0N4YN78_NIPBR